MLSRFGVVVVDCAQELQRSDDGLSSLLTFVDLLLSCACAFDF